MHCNQYQLEFFANQVCKDALTNFSRDFKVKREIGSGAFARVLLCERICDGQLFAVKHIDKRRIAQKCVNERTLEWQKYLLSNEIAVHRLASAHPNVATLYDVYEDATHLDLVIEYCCGGELFEMLLTDDSLSEDMAANITKQLCAALKFLHEECGIVHCDIKPGNVLFASKKSLQIKLVDFGMARVLGSGECLTYVSGSPHYTAPEVIATKNRQPNYAHPSDMWSLGVVLFAMVFKFQAFVVDSAKYKGNERKGRKAVYRRILRGFYPTVRSTAKFGFGPWFPDSMPASEGVRDLISSLLETDASKRLTAAKVLEHAWVREVASDCPSKASLSIASPKLADSTMSSATSVEDSDESCSTSSWTLSH